MATWPDRPVPIPPTWRAARVQVTDSGRLSYVDPGAEVAIPDELVLRDLSRLDASSPDAVAAFVHDFGLCFVKDNVLPHWTEVAGRLKVARALARHWAAHLARRKVVAAWTAEGFDDVRDASDAWARFTDELNRGLSAFHPYFHYTGTLTVGGRRINLHYDHAAARVDLYTALCLQLLNVIVEGIPPKACANEPCPNFFVRQTGTAKYGQYRTSGVLYCSKNCARAQEQRERRRRQKKETGR